MSKNNKQSQRPRFLSNHKPRNIFVSAAVLVVVLIVVFAALISGWIPYTAALIQCGKEPIITTHFLESATYLRPGDPGYGPSLFSDHYVCTEQEAINLGYSGPAGSLSNKQYLHLVAQANEASQFSPNKISFVAFTPGYLPAGYVKDIPTIEDFHGKQVLQYLKIAGKSTILIRQGDRSSGYAACSIVPCTAVGKDANGDIIYRSYSPNSGTTFWGIELHNSFINIETNHGFDISLSDASQIFSTLQALE